MTEPFEHHSNYVTKFPDEHGNIDYTAEEDQVWHDLIVRQDKIVQDYACQAHIDGLRILDLAHDRVPQPKDVSTKLRATTGWSVEPVAALISYEKFFQLLANQQFPAASFIRCREELDYLQEPDIFHEIYGHCPMLTDPVYASFMHEYGKLGLQANEKDRVLLARLYWFTVEFGLIKTTEGLRCYGGGILSSAAETVYAIDSDIPERKPFDALTALRTPYRIDIKQPIYYVLDDFQQLYDLLQTDLIAVINEARRLGEFPPQFPRDKPDQWVTC